MKEYDKVMEKVSPESLKDLILIAAEFDNVESRKEVELVLGGYMAGVIMERQGVESEANLRDILKRVLSYSILFSSILFYSILFYSSVGGCLWNASVCFLWPTTRQHSE